MKKNFYSNPFKLVWIARKSLLPSYLVIIWIIILGLLFFGSRYTEYVNLYDFNISNYFSVSITGLTFTLAIFTAEKNIFNIDELKVLAKHKGENDKYEGKLLLELIGPFMFTALIFLITGILALLVPYIIIPIPDYLNIILIQIYLGLLVLGLFSLFNLLVTMLNDLYHSITREL